MTTRHYVPLTGSPDWAAGIVANRKLMLGEQRRSMGNASFRNDGAVGKVWVNGHKPNLVIFGTGYMAKRPLFLDGGVDGSLSNPASQPPSFWLKSYIDSTEYITISDGFNYAKFIAGSGMVPELVYQALQHIGTDGYQATATNYINNVRPFVSNGYVLYPTFKLATFQESATQYLLSDKAVILTWSDYIAAVSTGSAPLYQNSINIPLGLQAALIRESATGLSINKAYAVAENTSIYQGQPYIPSSNGAYVISESFVSHCLSNRLFVVTQEVNYILDYSGAPYTPWCGVFPSGANNQAGWGTVGYLASSILTHDLMPRRITGASDPVISANYSVDILDESTASVSGDCSLGLIAPGVITPGNFFYVATFRDTVAPDLIYGGAPTPVPAPLFCCDVTQGTFTGVEECLNDFSAIRGKCYIIDLKNSSVDKYDVSNVPFDYLALISSQYIAYRDIYLSPVDGIRLSTLAGLYSALRSNLRFKPYIKDEDGEEIEISDNKAMLILGSLQYNYDRSYIYGVIVLL